MYIIYNEDGSIRVKNLNKFIQQGNNYADFIEIYILGKAPSEYNLLAHFTLDNGFLTNVELDEECEREFEGETIYGRKLSISKNETALAGKLKVNIQAIESGTDVVLTTYTAYLSVNEGVNPGELGYMSQEQTQQILDGLGNAATEGYVDGKIENLKNYTDDELDKKVDKETGKSLIEDSKVASYDAHLLDTNNPHQVSKSQVGLGNVANTEDSDTPVENGTKKFTTGGAWAIDQRVSALENIGRFLSLWNAITGEAVSNPPSSPYTYHTGDYFRVSVGGNRIPNGSSYTIGGTNYTTYAGTLQIGDVVYFDGTTWVVQAGSGQGSVVDVKVDGSSVVSAGTANITLPKLYKHNVVIGFYDIVGEAEGQAFITLLTSTSTPITTLPLLQAALREGAVNTEVAYIAVSGYYKRGTTFGNIYSIEQYVNDNVSLTAYTNMKVYVDSQYFTVISDNVKQIF